MPPTWLLPPESFVWCFGMWQLPQKQEYPGFTPLGGNQERILLYLIFFVVKMMKEEKEKKRLSSAGPASRS